ncbi:alpha1,3-fucosyltransferase [Aphelenchoides avenae]|nr:alpha1,3-fucosyltransferase [Aphelenchus avenae]
MILAYSAFLGCDTCVLSTLSVTIFARHGQLLAKQVNRTILMWTTCFDSRPTNFLDECPLKDHCELTYDRSLIEAADAVVFHLRDANLSDLPVSPPFDGQKFVAFTMESPFNGVGDLQGLPS